MQLKLIKVKRLLLPRINKKVFWLHFVMGWSRIQQAFRQKGLPESQVQPVEFGTLEAIIRGVTAGLGTALLPKSAVDCSERPNNVWIHQLPAAYQDLEIVFIYRKDFFITSAFQRFIDEISEIKWWGKMHWVSVCLRWTKSVADCQESTEYCKSVWNTGGY